MKTHLILLCAIGLGGGLVDGATNPINPSQDKQPTVLYVSGYQYGLVEHWHQRSDYYDRNGDHRTENWDDTLWDFQWSDGGGGSAYDLTSHKTYYSDYPNNPDIWSCEDRSIWPASTGPDLVSGTETEDTCGGHVPSETPAPILYQEHCVVSDRTNYTINQTFQGAYAVTTVDDPYNRKADTKMTLFTGGKSVAGRQNLFMLSGTANEVLDKRRMPPFAGGGPIRTPAIPAQNIQIMRKALGSDGNLYVVLPDGASPDVTPKVNGVDYYGFAEGQRKYHPYITAGGHNLDDETPEFCVGQGVSFTLNGLPGFVDAVGHWSLPGKYVNEQYQYSSSCTSYRVNSALLDITGQNLATACWYVNQPGGTVGVNANLHFSNGQYASVSAMGNFTVFRPTAEITKTFTPFYFTLSNTNPLTSELQLGDSAGNGCMYYWATVHSKYYGNANITQLITAGFSNPFYNFSDERCDGAPPYNLTPAPVFNDGNSIPLGLADGPYETWEDPNAVSIFAHDFVQFCPGGGGSIYVTLGIATWNASATARQYSMYGNWFIQNPTISGPIGPDTSDAFPVWTQIRAAH